MTNAAENAAQSSAQKAAQSAAQSEDLPSESLPSEYLITVLLPGLSLRDIPQCPALLKLSEQGAIGLLNTQNDGPRRISAAYLTIATGKKAACTEEAAQAWQQSEKIQELAAADFFQRYTGYPLQVEHPAQHPPKNTVPDRALVAKQLSQQAPDVVYLPYLQLLLNSNSPEVRLGLLGETLERHQLPLLLLGNQDLPEKSSRPGALLAMNEKGLVRHGIVDRRTCTVSNFSPTVYTTNYAYLYEHTERFLKENQQGLVLLDLGDLARLDAFSGRLSPGVYTETREKLLQAIDSFLAALQQLSAQKKLPLLIVAPYPAKEEVTAGNTLTPVCYYSPTLSGNRLLTSASTKRDGLITNLDIAPTILAHWGIPAEGLFSGNLLTTVACAHPLDYLTQQLALFQANHAQRPLLIKGYVLFLIILVLVLLFLLLLGKNTSPLYHVLSKLLLTATAVPLLLLLLPLVPTNLLAVRIIVLFAGVMVIHWLVHRRALLPLMFLYLFTVLAISMDLLLGAPLMKNSLLGYDPISGARYYGLGNEYLGVLFGSSVIGLTLLLETVRAKKGHRLARQLLPLLASGALFLLLLVAAPRWGTNVGGAITFLSSYLLLFALLLRPKLSPRLLFTTGLATVFFLLVLFAWDWHRPIEAQSHIGQTARLIEAEGPAALLPILARKISMNLKLFRYSLWSRVFLAFLAALAIIFKKPPGLLQRLFSRYQYLKTGFYTGLAGSFVLLAVNDSGIVAAGTSMLFIAPPLLYLVSISQEHKDKTAKDDTP